MHQTVPEFFRPGGPTAQTKFLMSSENGNRRMAITCIRYLLLCCANTSLADRLPDIQLWTRGHFEAYVNYLHQRPFIIYSLNYLEKHMQKCGEDMQISGLHAQLRGELSNLNNLFSCVFGSCFPHSWSLGVTANERHNSDNTKEILGLLLHAAIRRQYSRVVEALLVAGAEVETRQGDKTALMVAAESGDHVTVRVLLDQSAFVRETDGNKRTALHLAASNGHAAVVGLLIDRGAEKEAEDKHEGRALHFAAASGHAAVVELLIDCGADKEAEGIGQQRALHLAAANGHDHVIELLVGRGADKEARDALGWHALHMAAWKGHVGTIRMLVQSLGVKKEVKDSQGWTALHVAGISGQGAVIHMLVENLGANIGAKDKNGWTVLHLVAALGLKNVTRLLAETLKMDKNAWNMKGQTALKLAQK